MSEGGARDRMLPKESLIRTDHEIRERVELTEASSRIYPVLPILQPSYRHVGIYSSNLIPSAFGDWIGVDLVTLLARR